MNINPQILQRARVCLLLCAAIFCAYMLSYRAVIQSGDTLRAFDAMTSQLRYGDWRLDESAWSGLPRRIQANDKLPLREYDVEERLHVRLAMPLLQLAQTIPRLGNIHAVWLFNVIVTTLIVGLMYLLLRTLGHGDAVALLVALGCGLATNLWAYSQAFFREPLAALFILLALLCLQVGSRRRALARLLSWTLAAVALYLATQVKMSAALALPALLIFAAPATDSAPGWKRRLHQSLVACPLLLLAFGMFVDPLPAFIVSIMSSVGLNAEYVGTALRAYILSPGGGIFGSSPVALLAIGGCWLLLRRGQGRLPATITLMVAGYAVGHALLAGEHWFGGLSYPPRFMTPTLPVVMLAAAPVVERALQTRSRRLAGICVALLVYGLWIQFNAVSLSWSHFSASLPAELQSAAEWTTSLWQPQRFRWFTLPGRWGDLGVDYLWLRGDLPVWALSYALLGALSIFCVWRIVREPATRWRHMTLPLAFLCLPLTLLNLSSAYERDPRTQSGHSALREAVDYLAAQASQGDILLLGSNDYGGFIMNHLDSASPRPVILPRPPAQAASDKQPALVESDNPNDWFDAQPLRAMLNLANHSERLWLLTESGPFHDWSYRPLERYLAQRFFPLRDVALESHDPTVRVLEYSVRAPAPHPHLPFAGDIPTDLRFGEHIQLASLTLPTGLTFHAGGTVEVSLQWQTDAPLERNYTIALFAVDLATQQVIAQGQDSAPQAGFAPTNSWAPDQRIHDNRALRLPETLAGDEIGLWLAVYRWDSELGDIRRLPIIAGESVHAGEVAVLPITIDIQPRESG